MKTQYFVPEWKTHTWEDRVADFLKTEDTPERFNWPFPMAVFGTLRKHQGNNRLMHGGKVTEHRLAFLPHFYASGLSVSHEQNSTAPFEVFYYSPEEWSKMIYSVDCLESFDPVSCHGKRNRGYYYRTLAWLYLLPEGDRTLTWLHLLPEGYQDKWFPDGRADLYNKRNMGIKPEIWKYFERVPCWIYSNMQATKEAVQEETSPIIWPKG